MKDRWWSNAENERTYGEEGDHADVNTRVGGRRSKLIFDVFAEECQVSFDQQSFDDGAASNAHEAKIEEEMFDQREDIVDEAVEFQHVRGHGDLLFDHISRRRSCRRRRRWQQLTVRYHFVGQGVDGGAEIGGRRTCTRRYQTSILY